MIDLFSSAVHLVPTLQTYTAKDVADVVFDTLYRHHGLPEAIVSDRDSLFTSTFWKELHRLLGVELHMSSAYHPQSDGRTERANAVVTNRIRSLIHGNQKDWASKLPLIEFAMNSASSERTGYAPFEILNGRRPAPILINGDSSYPGVKSFARNIATALSDAHDASIDSRTRQTFSANKHRRPASYNVGDLVYVSTKNFSLPKGVSRKFAMKFIGPCKIIRVISANTSYEIDLPADLRARGIHPVFHTSLLRPHVPNDDVRFPGRRQIPVSDFGPVDELIAERILRHEGGGTLAKFLVKWSTQQESWEPYAVVRRLSIYNDYLEAMDATPKTLRSPMNSELETEKEPQETQEFVSTANVQPYGLIGNDIFAAQS